MTATGRTQHRPIKERPVIFGEVLFDTFPDGSSVLGGAPFNVAWHLQGFGLDPLFISRVGNDSRGADVLNAMTEWGMDTDGLQLDPHYPTGLVEITLDNGQPDFTILPDQSYDHIDPQAVHRQINAVAVPLLYHGSLIHRSVASSQALQQLKNLAARIFVDINLRKDCWTFDRVDSALQSVAWAKLNDAELQTIAGRKNIHCTDIGQCANAVKEHYSIGNLIITQGASGAFIACDSQTIRGAPKTVDALVDTVGAGDAFSSVAIMGILRQWPIEKILANALEFASAICAVRGATTRDKTIYKKLIKRWGMDD